ncbi:FISUMP domain-containing protein [Bacteroidota bacterium]
MVICSGCEKEKEVKNDGPFPELQTFQVDNITGNSFTISGQVVNDNGLPILEKGFIWSKLGLIDRQFHEGHVIITESSDIFTSSITGLLPSTQYIACSFATNINGTAYGNIEDFYTTDRIWSEKGSFTDSRDGQEYEWVKIGNQIWMAENLRYMPFVCDSFSTGIWVYGKYSADLDTARNEVNYQTFGCLYDYATASTISPDGWHLPSSSEWQVLINFLGGEDNAGSLLKSSDPQFWIYQGSVDATGFKALPGGAHMSGFRYIGDRSFFWNSTEYNESHAEAYYLSNSTGRLSRTIQYKYYGLSVRCLKD